MNATPETDATPPISSTPFASEPAHPAHSFGKLLTTRAVLTEIWDNLPIWFFYLEAVGLVNFLCANVPQKEFVQIGIPRSAFAWTAVFPIFWVIVFYTHRVLHSRRLAGQPLKQLAVPAGLATVPVLIYGWYALLPFLRMEVPLTTLVRLFEAMQLLWIALFMAHVATKRGWKGFVTFFVVCWLYGLVLENGGIIMGYFFEPTYRFYLGRLPAPFATMMGWCLAFYACIWIAEWVRERVGFLRSSVIGSALLTTAIAISLDLQLDPLASLSGAFWRWNDLLPAWFLTVPWVNYLAWFSAFLPFSYAYFLVKSRADLNEPMRNRQLLAMVPNICVAAGLLFFGVAAVLEGGFDGPTYRILGQFFDKILPY